MREEWHKTGHLGVENLVAKLDERDPPHVNAAFLAPSRRASSRFDRGSQAIVGSQDPEDGLEVRQDAREEEQPDLVEAREEAAVIERLGGCWRGELVREGRQARADEVGQVGGDETRDERGDVD